jgi:hypothetical protein
MGLDIATFSNVTGGNALFKALTHPMAADAARTLIAALRGAGPVAVYDPLGHFEAFVQLYRFEGVDVQAVLVQRIEDMDRRLLGQGVRAVSDLPRWRGKTLFVAAFDAQRTVQQIRHLIPEGVKVVTLDEMRLPDKMLTNVRRYLDPLNFATNFALFRDRDGHHTRLVTSNYWHGYGARGAGMWLCLFDHEGQVLAQWPQEMPVGAGSVIIDSAEVRRRFALGEFQGSLFMHVTQVAGHDIVKYALDTYGDDPKVLSCTHDANSWPSEFYGGLPAPKADEEVVLWIENSLPIPIPAGQVGLRRMGREHETRCLQSEIPAFGTYGLNVAELLPEARWPEQLEVCAGKYFVRPRYEILTHGGRSRIAHVNVERNDLGYDADYHKAAALLGKGYILPAPVLPVTRFRTELLPTPMATCQQGLALAALIYDANGTEIARHTFGRMPRNEMRLLDVNAFLLEAHRSLPSGYGHVELTYDLAAGDQLDGWLHGLFRYQDLDSSHVAETSFGAHIFNIPVVYKNEPQSYAGPPPGLSTRLFLRLGEAPLDSLCHLIYPTSGSWHPHSATELILCDRGGAEVAKVSVAIPCSGSLLWRYSEMFDAGTRGRAGRGAYVMVRDLSCRLFGYHGLVHPQGAFSFDHMFGF